MMLLYYLACTANDLPEFTYAQLEEGSSTWLDHYNPGEEVTYECDDGFLLDPSIPALSCFCVESLDGTADSWSCTIPKTTTACIPSEQLTVLF